MIRVADFSLVFTGWDLGTDHRGEGMNTAQQWDKHHVEEAYLISITSWWHWSVNNNRS